MLYRLIILNGPQTGLRWSVPDGPLTIGRAPDCGLRLSDSEVAVHHAMVEPDGDALRVRDLGTMHRLLINQREKCEARLKHGDVVEIGRTRLLVEAVVRAEVEIEPHVAVRSRRRPALIALAALVLLAAGGGGWALRLGPWTTAGNRDAPAAAAPIGKGAQTTRFSRAPVARGGPVEEPVTAVAATSNSLEDRRLSSETPTLERRLGAFRGPKGTLSWNVILAFISGPRWRAAQSEMGAYCRGVQRRVREWGHVAETALNEAGKRVERSWNEMEAAGRELVLGAPAVRLAEVAHVKFPADEKIGEMRVLNIQLERTPGITPPESGALRVEVTFYERETATGRIRPAAGVNPVVLSPEGPWREGEPLSVVVPYQGAARATESGVPSTVFHGYRVRVLAHGRPAAEWARPRGLALSGATAAGEVVP
jgi:hypothetical protein